MRKTIILFVMMVLLVCMAQPALANIQPIFEPVPADQISELSMNNEWDKMRAKSNPDNTFKQVEYYVKSTGATSGIRYRTKRITFSVGEYGPASMGAEEFRFSAPGPGETIYDKVILPRDFFRALLGSTFENGPELVGHALDTENYLHVGAVIEIYNANTGQVLETINSPEECQTKGSARGFGTTDIADMKSRWQEVPLREIEPPDFFSTPEGSNEWKESYKDPNTCAKTYEADPGTTLNIPITLHNSGTQAITDFKATWYNSGPAGWANPVWSAGEINLPANESQQFIVPVTIPQQGQENRLVFKANVNGNNPASETNQDNNITIIRAGSPGVDLKVEILLGSSRYFVFSGGSNASATIKIDRLDSGTNPVQAVYKYKIPGQSEVTQTLTIPPKHIDGKYYTYYLPTVGSYNINTSIYPIGVEDTNPNNNEDSDTQWLELRQTQKVDNSSPKTRVGLTG